MTPQQSPVNDEPAPAGNRQWVLDHRPTRELDGSCFSARDGEVPVPKDGEVLVRVHWLGIDPTQRGWLNEGDNYREPIPIGAVMRGAGVGQVVESRAEQLPVGSWVYGEPGWQEYATGPAGGLFGFNPVPPGIEPRLMLSVFGTTGLTAYFGMVDVGAPEPGQTVVVSAAAGATGSMAAQIAKSLGCRVIGIAGGRRKCDWVTDTLGLDACIDHRAGDVPAELARLAPDGIDVYFDNVGGPLLEAALANLAAHARVVLCGAVATGYSGSDPVTGPRNYMELAMKRARMEGFIFLDHVDRFPEAFGRLHGWLTEGGLVVEESIADGIESAPEALAGLFTGRNLGKQLVRVVG